MFDRIESENSWKDWKIDAFEDCDDTSRKQRAEGDIMAITHAFNGPNGGLFLWNLIDLHIGLDTKWEKFQEARYHIPVGGVAKTMVSQSFEQLEL
jgi:hypothetical protein